MVSGYYRPQVGETLFVALYDQQPFVATVTGYRHDERLGAEMFEYTRKGKPGSSILRKAVFYPDVPASSVYIYVVVMEQSEFMEGTDKSELGYFFDPKSAFDYLKAIEAGEVEPRVKPISEYAGYLVQVEEV